MKFDEEIDIDLIKDLKIDKKCKELTLKSLVI